jgi:2-keto-4-pentenoate hydratase/2-oxohepta-3-ene-1,7-dioic acid hydratase in catechol pathway
LKLVTYTYSGTTRLGAVSGDAVVDLAQTHAAFRRAQEGVGPLAGDFPTDMLAFLQAGDAAMQAARETLTWLESAAADIQADAFTRPFSEVQINPPVTNPSKIVCVGLNYADHCREQNVEAPKSPVLFAKFPSALIGPGEAITWPPEASQKVDYEAELAVVIGRVAQSVPAAQALDHVAGYTIVNDISARDVQFGDQQWVRGKSFDTFCPMGPYLVTPDEVGDPHELGVRCRVNGELRQDSSTREMIFTIPYLIEFISATCTLLPGDIISTGTPHGVGVFREPPVFLKPGDVVEVEVDRVGCLRNPVG